MTTHDHAGRDELNAAAEGLSDDHTCCRLAGHSNVRVLRQLSANPDTCEQALITLLDSGDSYTVNQAQRRLITAASRQALQHREILGQLPALLVATWAPAVFDEEIGDTASSTVRALLGDNIELSVTAAAALAAELDEHQPR